MSGDLVGMTDRRTTTPPRPLRLVAAAVAAGCVLAVPALASAHIEPDPPAVEAGTEAVVGFLVEHGCEGSPTTELRFQVPAGVTDAAPVEKDGWRTSLTGDVVTFKDGSLDAETADRFEIRFTAPATAGPIAFPVVQQCETGELAWIDVAAEGEPEPTSPAPTIEVTAGPPTAAELGAPAGDDAEHEHHGDDAPEPADTAAAGAGGVSRGLIGAGIGAVVNVGATALLVRRRQDTTG